LQESQRFGEALEEINTTIAIDQTDADFFVLRGMILEGLKRKPEALAEFSRALVIDESHAARLLHRGVIYGPLLMFDPASPVLLFSPSGDEFSPESEAEGNLVMTMLWESPPSDLKAKKLEVEITPFELLPLMLQ
jgi:hypothetical protein